MIKELTLEEESVVYGGSCTCRCSDTPDVYQDVDGNGLFGFGDCVSYCTQGALGKGFFECEPDPLSLGPWITGFIGIVSFMQVAVWIAKCCAICIVTKGGDRKQELFLNI